jgi:hypothetical protein
MTRLPRTEVLRVLRAAGLAATAERVAGLLPDPFDLDRDRPLLDRYGISRDVLVDRLGGSS